MWPISEKISKAVGKNETYLKRESLFSMGKNELLTISHSCTRCVSLFGAILFVTFSATGPASAQPPAVDWRRSDWLPTIPPLNWLPATPPVTPTVQAQDKSGEDWWYYHTRRLVVLPYK